MHRYKTHLYNTQEFDFVKILCDLFTTNDLSSLHLLSEEQYDELFEVGKDSITIFHTKFYDKLRAGWPEMQEMYKKFISEFVSLHFTEDFLYQSFPTFRVHLPNNIAVGAFHNDAQFHHPEGEINFIIPITHSDDMASIWVESEPGKKDFKAMRMEVGSLIEFDGNRLTHGNYQNTTDHTRVSMDFRILAVSKYKESEAQESMTTNTKFEEGKYYTRFTK